jgi:hypothetical protein
VARNFKALADDVQGSGDVQAIDLGTLRSMLGYDRLGKMVLRTIANELESVGLGYFPLSVLDENEYPRQNDTLRVFRRGSAMAEIVQAVLKPTMKGDERLRDASAGDTGEVLKQIRLLVCAE